MLDMPPESVKENGNHFMAIFPVRAMREHVNATRGGGSVNSGKWKQRVRGGATATSGNSVDGHHCRGGSIAFSSAELVDGWPSCGEWFGDFKYGYTSPIPFCEADFLDEGCCCMDAQSTNTLISFNAFWVDLITRGTDNSAMLVPSSRVGDSREG